ncbi:uncharacterized protein LOC116846863 isoform X7 [Odontomachus brunneus]|uniref:uncharacterized protein LOC116846863 isoform X7 n=1 Tax=Odontomachus brunneus TaxID=486640 RepID=UPI0013F1AEC1|nr:uncharacterized protein LOC116846863 isoform X7 [Odontomachus brunneus]
MRDLLLFFSLVQTNNSLPKHYSPQFKQLKVYILLLIFSEVEVHVQNHNNTYISVPIYNSNSNGINNVLQAIIRSTSIPKTFLYSNSTEIWQLH